MAKRGLKLKVEGQRPNDLCHCGSTDKKLNILKLHELYENGTPLNQLGELVGVHGETIRRWFIKHELPTKNKSNCRIGKLNASYKGIPYITKNGYVEIRKNQKQILEHRAVMEDHLNRPLLKSEIVHHINGIKTDNELKNLKLMNQSTHRTEHILPNDQWSYHYDKCVKCETTNRKHAGHGLCTRCHQMAFVIQKRGYECEYREDGTRIFSEDHIEKLRAARLLCETRKKYKKCHGKGVKGTGKFPRESANRHNKITQKQITESTRDILQFQMIRQMMRKRNLGIKV